MTKIAPSLLATDLSDIKTTLEMLNKWDLDMLHLDVMDGHFVPPITFGSDVVKGIREKTDIELDCHLMVTNPEEQVPLFLDAGADWISIHVETTYHPQRILSKIRNSGCKAGITLNPLTPICYTTDILEYVDMVLLMSVNPGYGGQSFLKPVLNKLSQLKELINDKNYDAVIQIDGGINKKNIKEISDAGADIIVIGSGIFNSNNPEHNYKEYLKLANR
jgi:ribulose-phosphate 3-epimerase